MGTDALKQLYMQLCERVENDDPIVQSFLPEQNRLERLLADIDSLYCRFPDLSNRPALFGVPVGVKDIFRIAGQPTRAGSQLPVELFEGNQAWIVSRLIALGAIIFGKTVTTEFAYFEPGPTKNPHNIEHTPGGSSSGSAAAIAAGFVPLTIGSQTIGSIGRPASFCGVFGYKPSFGRILTNGTIPFSPSADHIGFFTQSIEQMLIAAKAIVSDWDDIENSTADKPVLAIPTGPFLNQAEPEMLAFFNEKIQQMEKLGFSIKKIDCMENIQSINTMHRAMIAAEFAQTHEKWFENYPEKYSAHATALIKEGKGISAKQLTVCKAYRFELLETLEKLLQVNECDLWLTPAALGAAPKGLASTGSPLMSLPWTMAGLPTLTIPAEKNKDNLPLGIQIIGSFMQDEQLLFHADTIVNTIQRVT